MNQMVKTKAARVQFDWKDPFLIEQQLTEEERMIRDTAHAYCQEQLMPRVLEQFRHAIRRRQYACPRGFSDPNCTPIDDVRREIKEELGADIIGKPIELGRIAADSGLTGGCVHVFLTNIGAYKQRCGHEGIISTIELTRKQMEICVSKKRIDDGFTLGALELERCWRLKRRRAGAEL